MRYLVLSHIEGRIDEMRHEYQKRRSQKIENTTPQDRKLFYGIIALMGLLTEIPEVLA